MNINLLIGTLLGDATIYKYKKVKNSYTFKFKQSIKEYALWKADLIGTDYRKYEYDNFDKRTNKSYYSYQIVIILPPEIKKYLHELFYKPEKEVTLEILNQLDDLAIALWYFDDGSIYYNGNNCHLVLATNGFTDNCRNLIIEFFKNKYDIVFKKCIRGELRLTSIVECKKFMKIIDKNDPKCMEYKLLDNVIKKHIDKKNSIPIKIRKSPPSRPVYRFSKDGKLIKKYNSVKEASIELGISINSIRCNLCGKCKLTLNSKWSYDYEQQ